MQTIEANPTSTTTQTCPLCGTPLSADNPNACTHCDWVASASAADDAGGFRDRVAVCLSVVPGLGHVYKGHRVTGALYMLGAVFAVFAAFVASTATAGFGIFLLPLYWIGIMLQVYFIEDLAVRKK